MKCPKSLKIPYTIKPSWIHRLLFVALSVSVVLMFFFLDNGEFWNSTDWILRNILIFLYGIFVVQTIGMFLRKVAFLDDNIQFRNNFGITKTKKYKDISEIKGEEENISIKFCDNSLIKVWESEGNVHRVLRIIKKKREE